MSAPASRTATAHAPESATLRRLRGALRLGYGCSGPLGARWFSERKARTLIERAVERGVAHFDTASFYGAAEARLGRALAGVDANEVFVSSKTGTRALGGGRMAKDFSPQTLRRDVDASLQLLRRDTLDLLYLHGPNSDQLAEAAPALAALKAEGRVASVGVCTHGEWLLEAANAPEIDVVMGAYSVLDRTHEEALSIAKKNGKAVVAISPLAQGRLQKRGVPRTLSDLRAAVRAVMRREFDPLPLAAALRAAAPEAAIAQLALGFVLSAPFVDVALTTTTRRRHLDELTAIALDLAERPFPAALRQKLAGLSN